MANVDKHKKIGPAWSNQEGFMKLTYDFSNDGGATGTYTLANVDRKIMITKALVQVETACAGATAVVTIGSSSGDPDGFLDSTSGAVANLIDDYTVEEASANGLVVADTETINLVITTAALTAGKINVYIKYVNVD